VSSYPAISGVSLLTGNTFANYFADSCSRRNPVIMANQDSGDAMHPVHISNTTLVNVDEDSKVLLFRPKASEINQDGEAPRRQSLRSAARRSAARRSRRCPPARTPTDLAAHAPPSRAQTAWTSRATARRRC